MRHYRLDAHTKGDLKVHLVWVPKYRKAVLSGGVPICLSELLRQVAAEHELEIESGSRTRPHAHVRLVSTESAREPDRAPAERDQLARILTGVSTPAEKVMGRHVWGDAISLPSSGAFVDEMIREYIDEQECEQVADDGRFPIDNA